MGASESIGFNQDDIFHSVSYENGTFFTETKNGQDITREKYDLDADFFRAGGNNLSTIVDVEKLSEIDLTIEDVTAWHKSATDTIYWTLAHENYMGIYNANLRKALLCRDFLQTQFPRLKTQDRVKPEMYRYAIQRLNAVKAVLIQSKNGMTGLLPNNATPADIVRCLRRFWEVYKNPRALGLLAWKIAIWYASKHPTSRKVLFEMFPLLVSSRASDVHPLAMADKTYPLGADDEIPIYFRDTLSLNENYSNFWSAILDTEKKAREKLNIANPAAAAAAAARQENEITMALDGLFLTGKVDKNTFPKFVEYSKDNYLMISRHILVYQFRQKSEMELVD